MPTKSKFGPYVRTAKKVVRAVGAGLRLYKAVRKGRQTLSKFRAGAKRPTSTTKRSFKGSRVVDGAGSSIANGISKRYGGRFRPRKLSTHFKKKVYEAMFPTCHYNNTLSSDIVSNVNQSNWALFGLGQGYELATIQANAVGESSSASVGVSSRIELKDYSGHFTFTNLTNTSTYVRVYHCIPRYDLPGAYDYTGLLSSGFADYGTPVVTAGTSKDVVTDPAVSLFQNPRWTSMMKIVQVKQLEFNPGQVQTYNIYCNRGGMIPGSIFGSNGSYGAVDGAPVDLRKFCRYIVVQVWGQPIVDSSHEDNVLMSSCKVGVITERRYNYGNAFPAVAVGTYTSSLPAITGNPTLINDLSGAVVTAVAA